MTIVRLASYVYEMAMVGIKSFFELLLRILLNINFITNEDTHLKGMHQRRMGRWLNQVGLIY